MVHWLGHQGEVSLAQLEEALLAQIQRGCDTASSQLCRAAVDGKGVQRVLAAMLLDSNTVLIARNAIDGDEALLLEWANDPTTRRNSFAPARIAEEEHRRWFWGRLHDVGNCRMFIVETEGGTPLGQVRFDKERDTWRVSFSIGEPFRGRGLGRRILEIALLQLRSTEAKPFVIGRVAAANLPSHKIFQGLGFVGFRQAEGVVEYRLGG
jgi:RimJ/RimL family protein N-acetyltransferase